MIGYIIIRGRKGERERERRKKERREKKTRR